MKVLIVAVSAAVGFAIAFYWPGRASEEVRNDRGTVAGAPSSNLALTPEDATLLDFARSLATGDASGLGPLYASLHERFGPGRIEMARRLVWLRWAETAPLEALAWLKVNAPRDLEVFLVAWSANDPVAAWRAARADCVRASEGILLALSDRVDREPPEAVIALLGTFPDEAMFHGTFALIRETESLYAAAFHKFASANPVAALERALELTGLRRAAALAGVAAARAERNPDEAIEWARSITEKADRRAALRAVMVEISRGDPEAAGALLKETDNPFESATGGPGAIILRRLSKDDPAMAFEWAARYAPPGDNFVTIGGQLITQTAARAHPRELPAILASIENPQLRSQAIQGLDLYARPAALPELIEGAIDLPPGAERDAILHSIFRAWADASPDEALARARALTAGPMRDAALADIAGKLVWRHPDSLVTLEASNSLPSSLSPRLHAEWITSVAVTSPENAAAMLDALTDPALRETIAKHSVEQWMEVDTPAALGFAETLSGSERTAALGRLFGRWSAADPAAVTDWLAAQPPGGDRDAAIEAFVVEAEKHGEHEAAFRWTLETSDPAKRKELISVSAWRLASYDRELAVRVAAEARLDEAERAMVNAMLAPPPPPAK